tara:strand:+ start:1846 stop:2502 length:657 start_codon:yes stop_codon:yes gene_type:complete
MSDIFIISATKGAKEDTLLYKSSRNNELEIFFKENNKDSLQTVYNKAIDFAIRENVEYLVMVHDDVILENVTRDKLIDNFELFDMFGVAGTSEVKLQEPALWHIMGGGIHSNNLHGAVAHLNGKRKSMTSFGTFPHRALMVDGVFMAVSRKVFKKVRFDEDCPCKFHFYDLDYSLSTHKADFKVGVSDVYITHASPGLKEFTEDFNKGSKWFLNKHKG